jgi:hypothetical protein
MTTLMRGVLQKGQFGANHLVLEGHGAAGGDDQGVNDGKKDGNRGEDQ